MNRPSSTRGRGGTHVSPTVPLFKSVGNLRFPAPLPRLTGWPARECGSACSIPSDTRWSEAGSGASTASGCSSWPRRRCSRSSREEGLRESTPSIRCATSCSRTGAPPAVRPPLRRPIDVRVREPGGCRRSRCGRGRSGREPDGAAPTCRRDRRGASDRRFHRARRVARTRRGAAEGWRFRSRARCRRRDAGRARRARRPSHAPRVRLGARRSRAPRRGPVLYPGDIVAGPASDPLEDLGAGAGVSIEIGGIGVLEQRVTG